MSEYDNLLKSELIKQAQEMEETIGNCLEEIDQLKAEIVELIELNKVNSDDFFYRLEKYRQTLKEIKEIAEHCMKQDLCTFCDYNDKCYKGFEDEALSYDVCKIILEKISEVIDG